jgi:bifunctional DNase/RNase
MKRQKIDKFSFFIIILITVSVGIAVINLEKEGLVEANVIRVIGNTIIIANNCTGIVADTSIERALSIDQGLKGKIEFRPNTHDTFVAVLKSFNITLDSVEINKFENNTYYSDIIFSTENKTLRLDAKPSDAIAIALRTNSTVFIDRNLLNKYGTDICL